MIPMIIATPHRAFLIAGVCTVASVIARGLRFFIVAGLLWKFGPSIRDFIEKRLGLMFTLFCILLVGGFAAVRYL